MGWIKSEIKKQWEKFGDSIYIENSKYFAKLLSDSQAIKVNSSSIKEGEFYFILYDLAGKSSKMEKFIPCIYLGDLDTREGKKSLCFSFNFLPIAVRTVFLDTLLSKYDSKIKSNIKLEPKKQVAYDVDFESTYKGLKTIGFEYSIREIYTSKINTAIKIDTNDLIKFITMNTYLFTGVPEDKLAKIWLAKLNDKEKREKEFLQRLIGDFSKMESELKLSLNEQKANILDSLNTIKNIK